MMRAGVTACALLLTFGACRHGFGPITGDTFVLRSVSGDELPAPYAPNPQSPTLVIADTLVFGDNQIGEQRAVYENADGGRWSARTRFTYERVGDRIEISYVCADNASCIAPPHHIGTLSGTELLISSSNVSRVPLVFERVTQ